MDCIFCSYIIPKYTLLLNSFNALVRVYAMFIKDQPAIKRNLLFHSVYFLVLQALLLFSNYNYSIMQW